MLDVQLLTMIVGLPVAILAQVQSKNQVSRSLDVLRVASSPGSHGMCRFEGDDVPIVRGSALAALQGKNDAIGK